jgi:transposase
MLYLGIDQHARQITISLRDENGDVLQARQVSSQPENRPRCVGPPRAGDFG